MNDKTDHRVVVTGYGCLTAAGHDANTTWAAIKNAETGIAPITQWDTTDWVYALGAEIKDYNPRKLIADRKLLKMLSRQDVLGLNAVDQAIHQSGLLTYRDTLADPKGFNDRTGVFVGSPGNKFQQQYDFMPLFAHAKGSQKAFGEGLFEQVHPMWLLRILPNNVLAYVGIQHGFKGPNENITNHGVSGTQALSEAYHFLKRGTIDRAIVVGYEAGIEPQSQVSYGGLGVLSTTGVRPFDTHRDGTILGEGAGVMILESLDAAKARDATLYGEILGSATTSEAMGVFPIRNDASGLISAIQNTCDDAHIQPSEIGMITAHGNGTKQSDATEALAISTHFGVKNPPVTAFKWSIGHTIAAAGVIESILTLQALRDGTAPGIATLENKASDCSDINASNKAQATLSSTGLIITRSFSSLTSCLILRSDIE